MRRYLSFQHGGRDAPPFLHLRLSLAGQPLATPTTGRGVRIHKGEGANDVFVVTWSRV